MPAEEWADFARAMLDDLDRVAVSAFVAGVLIAIVLIAAAAIAHYYKAAGRIIAVLFWVAVAAVAYGALSLTSWFFALRERYVTALQEGQRSFFESVLSPGWPSMGEMTIVLFTAGAVGLIMSIVASWLDLEESGSWVGLQGVSCMLIGIIFAFGFIEVLQGVSLVLGIIATIVAILVGIKKLSQPQG